MMMIRYYLLWKIDIMADVKGTYVHNWADFSRYINQICLKAKSIEWKKITGAPEKGRNFHADMYVTQSYN